MKTRHAYLGLVLALAGCLLLALCAPARAQQVCATRSQIVEGLFNSFGERPVGFGATGGAGVVELLTSESGSWSLILTMPNGNACLIATGSNWETYGHKPGKDA